LKVLRDHVGIFAKSVEIREFKMPNLLALIERYVVDLNLPKDVYMYAERLYNLLPPAMRTRVPYLYPNYEARAIAYIVFILKLFFGLDGYKEVHISNSSRNINEQLRKIKADDSNSKAFAELFVWSEWVEFIEMRKIIISQYSLSYCRQFKQSQSADNCLEEFSLKHQKNHYDQSILLNKVQENEKNTKMASIQSIFERLATINGLEPIKYKEDHPSFPVTLTPSEEYLKTILQTQKANDQSGKCAIPDYMHVEHSKRTLEAHLDTRALREYLEQGDIELDIEMLSCNKNKKYVGVFCVVEDYVLRRLRACKADFNVDENEWLKEVQAKPLMDKLLFKKELETYDRRYYKQQLKKEMKKKEMTQTNFQEVFFTVFFSNSQPSSFDFFRSSDLH